MLMLLSIQQKYILKVLRKLGCIRRRQLPTRVQEKFCCPAPEVSTARLDAMLRQLRTGTNDVRIDGEFVWITGARPDALRLEAVDVMLELAEGKPEDFSTQVDRPVILRFSWGADLRLFTVAELAEPVRPTIEALAHQNRVIWLTESGVVPEGLTLPPKHFFAARMEDGTHRFYGSNGP